MDRREFLAAAAAVPFTLRSGTQSGATSTLTGLGVAHLRSPGRGDLVVYVEVVTPTSALTCSTNGPHSWR